MVFSTSVSFLLVSSLLVSDIRCFSVLLVVSSVIDFILRPRSCTFSLFFFLMIRRPPRSTLDRSSAASDVYKRQVEISGRAINQADSRIQLSTQNTTDYAKVDQQYL